MHVTHGIIYDIFKHCRTMVEGHHVQDGQRAHSVKVPRLYKVASGILQDYHNGKDSIKNLVFNCK